jgi:hypothetical protein
MKTLITFATAATLALAAGSAIAADKQFQFKVPVSFDMVPRQDVSGSRIHCAVYSDAAMAEASLVGQGRSSDSLSGVPTPTRPKAHTRSMRTLTQMRTRTPRPLPITSAGSCLKMAATNAGRTMVQTESDNGVRLTVTVTRLWSAVRSRLPQLFWRTQHRATRGARAGGFLQTQAELSSWIEARLTVLTDVGGVGASEECLQLSRKRHDGVVGLSAPRTAQLT